MHSLETEKWFGEKLHTDSIFFGSLLSVFMVHQVLATLFPEHLGFFFVFFFLMEASNDLSLFVLIPHPSDNT